MIKIEKCALNDSKYSEKIGMTTLLYTTSLNHEAFSFIATFQTISFFAYSILSIFKNIVEKMQYQTNSKWSESTSR